MGPVAAAAARALREAAIGAALQRSGTGGDAAAIPDLASRLGAAALGGFFPAPLAGGPRPTT
jgi:hypothetical protein